MSNKAFFKEIADKILEKYRTEQEFVSAYKSISEYIDNHNVSNEDMRYYFESGASEILAMKTQRYRKEVEKDDDLI